MAYTVDNTKMSGRRGLSGDFHWLHLLAIVRKRHTQPITAGALDGEASGAQGLGAAG